jgi:pimeloyl-ACP methyl ester carboxylesterase
MTRQLSNHCARIRGLNIFYREAGDRRNPTLLLLHGFPTSSVMFKNLMIALSDRFHLVAPDYPGFGFSDFPDATTFEYSFANISTLVEELTDALGLGRFVVYLHDYGCPIGLRLCVKRPEKIQGLIVQNGNAYAEGLGPEWDETKDYWRNPSPEKQRRVAAFLSEEGTQLQYTAGVADALRPNISPELWRLDWDLMKRPGNIEMQFTLNCDFKSNLEMYPRFQAYFRDHRPPALVIWGKHDAFFSVNEAACYRRDLPDARVHILDGAHMLLETNFDEVLTLVSDFCQALRLHEPGGGVGFS